MCSSEAYSRVRIGKLLSDMFYIQNDQQEGDALRHCFLSLLYNMPLARLKKARWD
jgi:hypothetical protein